MRQIVVNDGSWFVIVGVFVVMAVNGIVRHDIFALRRQSVFIGLSTWYRAVFRGIVVKVTVECADSEVSQCLGAEEVLLLGG